MIWTPQKLIFKTKNVPHKIVPRKFRDQGHIGPKRALLESPGAQKMPDTRSNCVVTMIPAQASQSGAVGTKYDPPMPPENLLSLQKGHLGQNGPPGVQKGPDTRLKCVMTMSPTQTSQLGRVGTKSGPLGPTEDL